MSFGKHIKTYFFRGLAVLLPTILTLWILIWGYKFIQENISVYINKGLLWAILQFKSDVTKETAEKLYEFWVDGSGSFTGFIIALIGVCIVGAFLASVVGKSLWKMIERFIMRTPFFKHIYPNVKQITDFLFNKEDKKEIFSKVVAVQYPRKGLWSMGLITGKALKGVGDQSDKEYVSVLIPTSPTPFTGFVIMLPKDEMIELDISIEDAIRFAVSGGVITPSVELGENKT
ncbi:MAG: DUF502 domain-containing protein [Phycisphaerae bacterium]|nr:DUF502 domain-containing protein [Phycisphaerae bacterium]